MLLVATVSSLAGVLGLYLYSSSLGAVSIQIQDIDMDDVGTIVRTEGYVTEQRLTSNSDLILTLVEYQGSKTIDVYVPKNIYSSFDHRREVLPSACIEVVGEVQQYQGRLEIVISSADNIKILQRPREGSLTIEMLALNPEPFKGVEVTVTGQIENIDSSFMWIEEECLPVTSFQLRYSGERMNYTMDCLLVGFDVSGEYTQGQNVEFTGLFDYYEQEAKWRILSHDMTLHS